VVTALLLVAAGVAGCTADEQPADLPVTTPPAPATAGTGSGPAPTSTPAPTPTATVAA
jgi:hypothetical protein